jgi:predicted O-methyltransferase YrrM
VRSQPENYASLGREFRDMRFSEYVQVIDNFPDSSFDVVFVDGRARASCVRHGIPKVRVGGYLVLDNADRSYYLRHNECFLGKWKRFVFSGVAPSGLERGVTYVFERID